MPSKFLAPGTCSMCTFFRASNEATSEFGECHVLPPAAGHRLGANCVPTRPACMHYKNKDQWKLANVNIVALICTIADDPMVLYRGNRIPGYEDIYNLPDRLLLKDEVPSTGLASLVIDINTTIGGDIVHGTLEHFITKYEHVSYTNISTTHIVYVSNSVSEFAPNNFPTSQATRKFQWKPLSSLTDLKAPLEERLKQIV